MTRPMPDTAGDERNPTCLDPALGDVLWRLADPDCPSELRGRLETHVTYCADCRLRLAVERETVAGLRDGSLDLAPGAGGRRRRTPWRLTAGAGAAVLAAGLALLLLLPPTAAHEHLVLRGDGAAPAIVRPVPDEVVLDRAPTVRWTPLPRASRYEVTVEAVGGAYRWTAATDEAAATVPDDRRLPADTRFRVRVEPVPAHAAPEGALRSSFRTGGPAAWLAHRLRHGAAAARGLSAAGLAVLAVGVAALLRGRRGA